MTDTTRQPTCAERIGERMADRLADLRVMLARDDPDEAPDAIDEPGPLNEYALGASVAYAVRVDLSTGGPADYITAQVDGGEVQSAEYHFADWFDHAERSLRDDNLDTVAQYLAALFDLDSLAEYIDR